MLKEITIESYKSLKNVTVQFKNGLNIIIGQNGSGKSNLLEFIDNYILNFILNDINKTSKSIESQYSYILSISDSAQSARAQFNIKNKLNIDKLTGEHKQSSRIEISVYNENDNHPYLAKEVSFSDVTLLDLSAVEFDHVRPYIFAKNIIRYNVPNNLAWLNTANKYEIYLLNEIAIIESPFENFLFGVQFRYHIQLSLLNDESKYDNIEPNFKKTLNDLFEEYKSETYVEENLHRFSPISKIRISPNANTYKINDKILVENLTLEFNVDNIWVPWSYLSDGTKRLFYIIAEISSQKGGLFLIEEPELGIHPHQLYKLMQFIKEQSEQKQIIISTHSPIILDCLDPDELDRITIARLENGSSQFHKLTEEQKSKGSLYMKEVGDLSYYWLHSDLENDED